MLGLIKLIVGLVLDLFRSRAALGVEIQALRQQIIVLRRGRVARLPFSAADRFVLGWVCRLFPNTLEALATIRPETVMRWHRAGFRSYWRWRSRWRPVTKAHGNECKEFQFLRFTNWASCCGGAFPARRWHDSGFLSAGPAQRPRLTGDIEGI